MKPGTETLTIVFISIILAIAIICFEYFTSNDEGDGE
jgi:hypothetical protein